MNKMISVQRAVLEAMEDIGHEEFDQPLIQRWCTDAEKIIGGRYQYKMERKVLQVENQRRAELPCNTFEVFSCFLGNVGSDCNIPWTSFDPAWTIVDHGANTGILIVGDISQGYSSGFSVVNNHIEFDCDISQSEITVYGLFYQIDSDGFIMVTEEHLPAIPYYVMKKVCERSRFGPKKMDMSDLVYFKSEWGKKLSIARAETSKLLPIERENLSKMIHNPFSGQALDYGRF